MVEARASLAAAAVKTSPTIRFPSTSSEKLRRDWARQVAMEVRDAIREWDLPYAIYGCGRDVHYEPAGTEPPKGWFLLGVYDIEADITMIADDVMLLFEREPTHAIA